MPAGKGESVIAGHKYSTVRKAIDCKRFFRVSLGMVGRQRGMVGRLCAPYI